MITLCRLTKPVSIQPPRSPQLAAFTFFTSCLRQPDGSERLYLHMGYFATLSDAQQWTQRMRTRYPNAVATPAPLTHLQPADSDVPMLPQEAAVTTPAVQEFPAIKADDLSDSQVVRILETRHAGALGNGADEHDGRVELLRPDDTVTRRSLKDAVVAGVPVPFAVQLEWSADPIDADRVPRVGLFKGYTLYRTEKRRGGRCCYFLRLGFFTDALSAREVACQVRSIFPAADVVPVTEQEFLHADEARIDSADPGGPFHESDEAPGSDQPAADNSPYSMYMARIESFANAKTASGQPARDSRETLEETLKMLAQRERWTQPDLLNDSGVRHLKVMIEEQPTKSAQRRKPPMRPV